MSDLVTREKFDSLKPRDQGYVWYMQGAKNESIPKQCPYPLDSKEAKQWLDGANTAYFNTLDCDDE
jgi:hypothetical protein